MRVTEGRSFSCTPRAPHYVCAVYQDRSNRLATIRTQGLPGNSRSTECLSPVIAMPGTSALACARQRCAECMNNIKKMISNFRNEASECIRGAYWLRVVQLCLPVIVAA